MDNVSARITPYTSLYILDFVDDNGRRIEEATGLDVLDGRNGCKMNPMGSRRKVEMYFIHSSWRYEICLRGTSHPIKTITFPVTVSVQCD